MSVGGSLTLLFEERETQAAESWRTKVPSGRGRRDSGAIAFSITDGVRRQRRASRVSGTRIVTTRSGLLRVKVQNQYSQPESLILAQNERWRQA